MVGELCSTHLLVVRGTANQVHIKVVRGYLEKTVCIVVEWRVCFYLI